MLLFFAVQLLDLKSQALKCKIMEIVSCENLNLPGVFNFLTVDMFLFMQLKFVGIFFFFLMLNII